MIQIIINDIANKVRATLLTGLSTATNAAITATDSVLVAFGKLQAQISDRVVKNAAITGATKTKITYDANGLVTSGTDATTADINDSSNRRYVTDAQQTVIGNTSGTNTGDQDLSGLQAKRIVVSGNTTAVIDGAYTLVASATFTDPSPTEGKGFSVLIRNGTATIGGTGYSTAGTTVWRVFHSGAWANYINDVANNWVDYSATSTIVGWSSFTTKQIRYQVSHKKVNVVVYLSGTSDSTTTSFTLPITVGANTPFSNINMGSGANNGVNNIIFCLMSPSGTIVTLGRYSAATTATITWTASGSKTIAIEFFYETD